MGVESIWRGMRSEDKRVDKTMNAYHATIHGRNGESEEAGDDMANQLIGGDLNEIHYHGSNENKGVGKLIKAAGIAALIAGSGGLGLAAPSILKFFSEEAAVVTDSSNTGPSIGFIELGEPDGD